MPKNQSNPNQSNDTSIQKEDGVSVTEQPEVAESMDFNKPDFEFEGTKYTHTWIQRGYEIQCTSCPINHGIRIKPNQIMVGIKDGYPVIKDRSEIGMA